MPTPLQMRNDELRRKRLMELMQAGQSRNMQDAQSQWDKEDFAETLRIGGTPDEKKYFDSLKMRGRAKQAEALLGGGTAESAVEWFPAANDANDYRGPMFRPPTGGAPVGGDGEMNPRLRSDLDVEQLRQARLKTEGDELAIRGLRRASDPTEARREMLNAESDIRRQQGVAPAPITVNGSAASGGPEVAPWKVAETGAERAGAFGRKQQGLDWASQSGQQASDRTAFARQMNTDPDLLAMQERARREGIEPELIKALSYVGQPGYTGEANPDVIQKLLDMIGGGKQTPGGVNQPGAPITPTPSHATVGVPPPQTVTLQELRGSNPGWSDADLLAEAKRRGVVVR